MLEQEESALAGRSYAYDPAGRRDPFRSLLVRPENRAAGSRPPGIAGVSVDDIVLQGIWKTQAGYVAQIRGTDNKSYLLARGRSALGRRGDPDRAQRGDVPAEPE